MKEGNQVKIPVEIGMGQSVILSVKVSSATANRLSDEDVIALVRENVDFDKLAIDLRRMAKG